MAEHPVATALERTWRGDPPPADGSWERVPPWRPGLYAVVALTGRALVSAPAEVSDTTVTAAGVDGFGGAHDPRVMTWLAGTDGWVDVLDAVLLAEGTGLGTPGWLAARTDLADHPRVARARGLRDELRVWSPADPATTSAGPAPDSVLTIGRGIGGLWEMSFEVAPVAQGRGLGRRLAAAARDLVPAGQPLVAAVSPGNAASLRALLAAGFAPVGSVQLYRPA